MRFYSFSRRFTRFWIFTSSFASYDSLSFASIIYWCSFVILLLMSYLGTVVWSMERFITPTSKSYPATSCCVLFMYLYRLLLSLGGLPESGSFKLLPEFCAILVSPIIWSANNYAWIRLSLCSLPDTARCCDLFTAGKELPSRAVYSVPPFIPLMLPLFPRKPGSVLKPLDRSKWVERATEELAPY